MATDVTDLHRFYHSPLGEVVASALHHEIETFKKNYAPHYLLGIGYTLFLQDIDLHLVPDHIGIMGGSVNAPSVLMDEMFLPLKDESMEGIVVLHMLEHGQNLRKFLREVWRVLKPEGRVLFIVPNRRGLWARFEHTPFGHGQPFSHRQIIHLLQDHMLTCSRIGYAIKTLPIENPWLLQHTRFASRFLFHRFSGVLVVEAMKQIAGLQPKRKLKTRFLPWPV